MHICFIRVCLVALLGAAPFDLTAVLWANLNGGADLDAATHSNLDRFSLANVASRRSLLWVHAVSVAIKTAWTLYVLDRQSRWLYGRQARERTSVRVPCRECASQCVAMLLSIAYPITTC